MYLKRDRVLGSHRVQLGLFNKLISQLGPTQKSKKIKSIWCIPGRRSQNPDLSPFNLEPERILRTKTPPITMADDLLTTRKMKEYYTRFTYTSTSCICITNTGVNHYDIKSSVIHSYHLFMDLPMRILISIQTSFQRSVLL